MKPSQILWLLLGVFALLSVVGWQRSDSGRPGKWQLFETRNAGILLLDSESGRSWQSKYGPDGLLTWVKVKPPLP